MRPLVKFINTLQTAILLRQKEVSFQLHREWIRRIGSFRFLCVLRLRTRNTTKWGFGCGFRCLVQRSRRGTGRRVVCRITSWWACRAAWVPRNAWTCSWWRPSPCRPPRRPALWALQLQTTNWTWALWCTLCEQWRSNGVYSNVWCKIGSN